MIALKAFFSYRFDFADIRIRINVINRFKWLYVYNMHKN